MIGTILSYLFNFLFSYLAVLLVSYTTTHKILLEREFGIKNFKVWTLFKVVLVIYAVVLLYTFATTFSITAVFSMLGLLIGLIQFVIQRGLQKESFIGKLMNYWIRKRRVRLFKKCPHCKKSHIFYRTIADKDNTECYFLVSKYNQTVKLGFYFNIDDSALYFLDEGEEKFEQSLEDLWPLLDNYFEDTALYKGTTYVLNSHIYCANCHEQFDKEQVEYGFVL